jgi:hypothetical protein
MMAASGDPEEQEAKLWKLMEALHTEHSRGRRRGRRRGFARWLAEVAGTLWVGLLGLLGGWFLGVASADKAWSFWRWLTGLF